MTQAKPRINKLAAVKPTIMKVKVSEYTDKLMSGPTTYLAWHIQRSDVPAMDVQTSGDVLLGKNKVKIKYAVRDVLSVLVLLCFEYNVKQLATLGNRLTDHRHISYICNFH